MLHFCLRLQNSEYPRIFRVTGANQNARKLLSTDLVNTKRSHPDVDHIWTIWFLSDRARLKQSLNTKLGSYNN